MLLYVTVTVLALGVMIYVGYHMVRTFTSDVETTPAYVDAFSESISFDAYIIRKEEVVRSNADGTVNYLVGDGEKVSVGEEIADICRGGSDGIRERVSAIDDAIKTLSDVENSAAYSSTSDAPNVELRIRALLYEVNGSVSSNDLLSASSASEKMLAQLNKHAILTGKIEGFADEIASLAAERERLISQLTDIADTVVSDKSAYFFYDVDGYESSFDFENIDRITIDDVYGMANTAPAADDPHAVGKFVTDYTWHIAVPADREQAMFFTEGEEYGVVFNAGGTELKMKLRSVLTEAGGDGRAALIFDCSELPPDFEYTRMQTVTVTVREYSGFRIPLSAIRVVDYDGEPVEGVYILYGGVVYFRRIEVILTQDGYALCDSTAGQPEEDDGYYDFPEVAETEPPDTSPPKEYEKVPYLAMYDLVITSARGLYDGKVISD